MKPGRALLIVLVTLLPLAFSSSALGHASLSKADPIPNASVRVAPTVVQLWFSEAVSTTYSTIRVTDSNGTRVDKGDVTIGPSDLTEMQVSLTNISPSIFKVSWQTLSAVDGHATQGSYNFIYDPTGKIGNCSTCGGGEQSSTVDPLEVVANSLVLASGAIVLGAYGFLLFVWFPAVASGGEAFRDALGSVHRDVLRKTLAAAVGAALVLPAALLAHLSLAALHTGGSPSLGSLGNLVSSTGFGLLWLLGMVIALPLAVLGLATRRGLRGDLATVPQGKPRGVAQNGGESEGGFWVLRHLTQALHPPVNAGARRTWFAALGGLSLALASAVLTSFASHNAAVPNIAAIAVAADFLHLTAVSLWVGGLILLAYVVLRHVRLLQGGDQARFTPDLVGNFSALATTCVGVVLATGIFMAILQVRTLDGLVATPYGWTLLAKVFLAVPLIALGVRNHFVMRPRLEATRGEPTSSMIHFRTFHKAVQVEALIGVAILVAAGLLTTLTPAASLGAGPPPPATLYETTTAGDLSVSLEISPYPSIPGTVDFNLFLSVAQATASLNVTAVTLSFVLVGSGLSLTTLVLQGLHPTHFYAEGPNLSSTGTWQVQAFIRRSDSFDVTATFVLTVG